MAKEEIVLQGMIDKLIETGRYYDMEINVQKTKVMRISRQPSPITITIDQKQMENVKCFKYLGSMLTLSLTTITTIIRKCKLLSMNGRHYNSLIYTVTAFCNLCRDGTSASICLRITLTNNHTSEE